MGTHSRGAHRNIALCFTEFLSVFVMLNTPSNRSPVFWAFVFAFYCRSGNSLLGHVPHCTCKNIFGGRQCGCVFESLLKSLKRFLQTTRRYNGQQLITDIRMTDSHVILVGSGGYFMRGECSQVRTSHLEGNHSAQLVRCVHTFAGRGP